MIEYRVIEPSTGREVYERLTSDMTSGLFKLVLRSMQEVPRLPDIEVEAELLRLDRELPEHEAVVAGVIRNQADSDTRATITVRIPHDHEAPADATIVSE